MSEIKKRTTIGGQALLEGILMRGPKKTAIVVRKPDGELEVKEDSVGTGSHGAFAKLPFIRGAVNLFDSLKYGISALEYSASFSEDGMDELTPFEQKLYDKYGKEKMDAVMMGFALFLGILLPIGLFFLLPTVVAGLFSGIRVGVLKNLLEGCVRICIFLGFIILTSKQKDIHRTYMYHGAEHKTIFCYEAGLPLTVENCRMQKRFHPRCGTSFLFVVVVISILISSVVFSFVEWRNLWVRFAMHLLLLIPIVGVAYEFNRYVGGHDTPVTRFLSRPGLWLQNFTTNEPDDSMLEVAIHAIELVIPAEKGKDKW